jgi:tocopherol O-methyltransferase
MQTQTNLHKQIAQFYDQSSGLWEAVWGEHMHHGYWNGPDDAKSPKQAQIDLMEELIRLAPRLSPGSRVLDMGCGIGGSSTYLAQRYGFDVTGITLSPVQAERARERAKSLGLESKVNFQVTNALKTPFATHSFDLIWSLESGEHMADKKQFLEECYRLLKPGGTLLFATWCCKDGALTAREEKILTEIYRMYHLPYVLSIEAYDQLMEDVGFMPVHSLDWSREVEKFWDLVIDSSLNPAILGRIFQSGWLVVQGALAMRLMRQGYRRGIVRYGVLTGVKA